MDFPIVQCADIAVADARDDTQADYADQYLNEPLPGAGGENMERGRLQCLIGWQSGQSPSMMYRDSVATSGIS
jgi:hypothetical protein